MEEETSQMSHLGLTNMTWTSLNLNLSLVRGQEEEVNQKVEGNSTSLNRLDTGLVYEAVVQVQLLLLRRRSMDVGPTKPQYVLIVAQTNLVK